MSPTGYGSKLHDEGLLSSLRATSRAIKAAAWAAILSLLSSGQVKPIVERTFKLDDAAEALPSDRGSSLWQSGVGGVVTAVVSRMTAVVPLGSNNQFMDMPLLCSLASKTAASRHGSLGYRLREAPLKPLPRWGHTSSFTTAAQQRRRTHCRRNSSRGRWICGCSRWRA